MDTATIQSKLQQQENKARGTKIDRLLSNPGKYIFSTLFYKVIYPIRSKGLKRTIKTFFGDRMDIVLPAGTDLYLLGLKTHDSELRLTHFLIRNLQKGHTIFDIGAHYGFFSLLSAQIVGTEGKVYAFDASEASFSLLSHNTAQRENISVFHNAVGDQQGQELEFFEFPVFFSEFNTRFAEQYQNESWFQRIQPKAIKVKGVMIDHFVNLHNVQPDLIKVDVEGAEYEVLNGMPNILEKVSPTLVMEFSAEVSKNEAHWKAYQLLQSFQYKPFAILKDGELRAIPDLKAYLDQLNMESDNIVFQK